MPWSPRCRGWLRTRVGNTAATGTLGTAMVGVERRGRQGRREAERPGISTGSGLTSSSACRHVPSPRNGATMSSVTGNLSGILVQRRSRPGLMPLRYWYPKKLSSAQCSATYSGWGTVRTSRRGRVPLRRGTEEDLGHPRSPPRPRLERPAAPRVAFSTKPPEGAPAQPAIRAWGGPAPPIPLPRRGVPPLARSSPERRPRAPRARFALHPYRR